MVRVEVLEERVIKLRAWLLARVKLAKITGEDKKTRFRVLVTYAFPEDKVFGRGRSWNSVTDWNPDPEQVRHLADVIELFDEKATRLELEYEEQEEAPKEEPPSEPEEPETEEVDMSEIFKS